MVLYRIQTTEHRLAWPRSQLIMSNNIHQLHVDLFLSLADSVANISRSITSGDRLLEIHNHELVSHPERDCL